MTVNTNEEIIFQLILHAGNGKSSAMEALAAAKRGDFAEAREKIIQAGQELNEAHQIQTSLIQGEIRGEKIDISLLMIHAQDHLMNAITVKELATEFIDLYERIHANGGLDHE
ncbi:PTS lactose/cellobiose transporter subunit IIA [Caldalkalibacillus mannanilyticus]|uniref:PTS lactose/cellobiose transporter subunit IIA n=1 Tax=Caldalkalibacillus mannanilyticus TaxID=1418 RepID=UPI00046933DC|nr:PTS lactose/cellobiose transporter subunit IIA [Caldalkalibacillus mannanilyticus]